MRRSIHPAQPAPINATASVTTMAPHPSTRTALYVRCCPPPRPNPRSGSGGLALVHPYYNSCFWACIHRPPCVATASSTAWNNAMTATMCLGMVVPFNANFKCVVTEYVHML